MKVHGGKTVKKVFTLWLKNQDGVSLLGEFPARGKAIIGAQPFIPEGFTPANCWQKEGDEVRLDMAEHGTLLVIEA